MYGVTREHVLRRKFQAALESIHAVLDGTTWSASTAEEVAEIMREYGFAIRDPSEIKQLARRKAAKKKKRKMS